MLTWQCLHFADLSVTQLYAILRLRQEVFVVEQNCAYLDADNKDLSSFHLLGYDADGLVAYCRLLPKRLAYSDLDDVSIGRVLSAARVRGTGAGHELMRKAIAQLPVLFGENLRVRIGAQSYLLAFYGSLGFVSTGKNYMEDDIPHTEMVMEIGTF